MHAIIKILLLRSYKALPVMPLQIFDGGIIMVVSWQQNFFSIKLTQRILRIIFRYCFGDFNPVIFRVIVVIVS